MMKKLFPNKLLLAAFALAIIALTSVAAPRVALATEITVYKSPWCGCCANWVDHMKANGYTVITKETEDMDLIKKMLGVPEAFHSCHTAMVEGYIVEGHVPADDVTRMLAEKPKAVGLAVPGMPAGSPGMEGGEPDKYDVLLFRADSSAAVYASY